MMTSHELARKLLTLPDYPVRINQTNFPLTEVEVWSVPDGSDPDYTPPKHNEYTPEYKEWLCRVPKKKVIVLSHEYGYLDEGL